MAVKGIKTVEYQVDADWAAGGGTFTEIPADAILAEEFALLNLAEEFTTRKANETDEQDGVRYEDTILVKFDEATVPANGDLVVLKITPATGSAYYIGGTGLAKVRSSKGGGRTLSAGQAFNRLTFTYAGGSSADVVKTSWS